MYFCVAHLLTFTQCVIMHFSLEVKVCTVECPTLGGSHYVKADSLSALLTKLPSDFQAQPLIHQYWDCIRYFWLLYLYPIKWCV